MQIASVSNLWLYCGALIPMYFMFSLLPKPSVCPVFDLQATKWEGLGTCSAPNRKCASETKVRVQGQLDISILFVSGTLQGRLYRSRYTYFSNLVGRTRLQLLRIHDCIPVYIVTQLSIARWCTDTSHYIFISTGTVLFMVLLQ